MLETRRRIRGRIRSWRLINVINSFNQQIIGRACVRTMWLSLAIYRVRDNRTGRVRFFILFLIRFETLTSQQLRSSSRWQHAEIEDMDILFFSIFFFSFWSFRDEYSVDGCMWCCAASCKHSCRAATSVHLSLQAAFVYPRNCEVLD